MQNFNNNLDSFNNINNINSFNNLNSFNSNLSNVNAVRVEDTFDFLNVDLALADNQIIKEDKSWNEWLAGLIDGAGVFLVDNTGNTSCEIILPLVDEHALYIIKNKLGGSVQLRSGAKTIKYRLNNTEAMLDLIHRINGNIRTTNRLKEFENLCIVLNKFIIYPSKISKDNGWFAGFFEAVGKLNITSSSKKEYPQLSISIRKKILSNVEIFKETFGGNIYFNKSTNGFYKWSIQSRKDIINFYHYMTFLSLYTSTKQRIFLINDYYKLKDLKAYTINESHSEIELELLELISSSKSNKKFISNKNKAWLDFLQKWLIKG